MAKDEALQQGTECFVGPGRKKTGEKMQTDSYLIHCFLVRVLNYSNSYNILSSIPENHLCFLLVPTGFSMAQKVTQVSPDTSRKEGKRSC